MKRRTKSSTTADAPGFPAISREAVQDRRGRIWTIAIVPTERAEEEDERFWAAMSPDERVAAVAECVLDCEKTRGKRDLPRLRRVYRVAQRASR